MERRNKKWTYGVFGLYMLFLIWLVLFKLATSPEQIPRQRGINLMPFYYDQENGVHLREVLYNVLLFVPAGFYFAAFFQKKTIFLGTAAAAALSLFFEISQWVFSIGASDITDLITNTAGGFCGVALFWVMGKVAGKRRMTIANAVGTVLELLGGAFLALLLIAN